MRDGPGRWVCFHAPLQLKRPFPVSYLDQYPPYEYHLLMRRQSLTGILWMTTNASCIWSSVILICHANHNQPFGVYKIISLSLYCLFLPCSANLKVFARLIFLGGACPFFKFNSHDYLWPPLYDGFKESLMLQIIWISLVVRVEATFSCHFLYRR